MGCHSLLQGIFLTQGSNLSLLHCRQILYHLRQQGRSSSKNEDTDFLGYGRKEIASTWKKWHKNKLCFRKYIFFYPVDINIEVWKLTRAIILISALRESLKRRKTLFQKDMTFSMSWPLSKGSIPILLEKLFKIHSLIKLKPLYNSLEESVS